MPFFPMTADRRGLVYQIMTAVGFVSLCAVNAPYGKSISDISNEHPTAITPAGYAFSIWGLIYAFVAAYVIWQALPSSRGFALRRVSFWYSLNFKFNMFWVTCFCFEWGDLWLSTVVIFGLLWTLIVLYRRIGFASDPTPGAPTSSYLEFWILRVPVSLYLGWVTVASILNVAVAATPKNGVASWGWTPSDWGIVMMTIAAVIALTAVARHWDGVFGGVVTWALVAIGKKQGTPGNPGDDRVVVTAFVLAGIVGTAAFLAVAQRLRLWYLRRGTPEGANNPQHLVISVEKEADPQLLQDTHDSPVDWK